MSDTRDQRSTEHEEWDELAAGYALDALDADEQMRITEHLATCEHCRASVDDHQLVAAQLGAIAHPEVSAEPPSWESIRRSVVGQTPDVADLSAHRRRRYELSRRSLSVAAAAVIVAGGGIAIWQGTTGGSSCSKSDGCHRVELDVAGGKTAANLTVHGQSVTMQTSGMPAAPSGKMYVLWQLPRDGRAEALTTFTAATPTAVTTSLDSTYSDTTGFAVSEEAAAPNPPESPSNQLATGIAV